LVDIFCFAFICFVAVDDASAFKVSSIGFQALRFSPVGSFAICAYPASLLLFAICSFSA
jgi:hypothetical protein